MKKRGSSNSSDKSAVKQNIIVEEISISSSNNSMHSRKRSLRSNRKDSDDEFVELDANAALSDEEEDGSQEKPTGRKYNKYAKKQATTKGSAAKNKVLLSQLSSGSHRSNFGQSQFSTKSPMGKRMFNQITQEKPVDQNQLWIEKYAPQTLDELAIDKRKLADFKRITESAQILIL